MSMCFNSSHQNSVSLWPSPKQGGDILISLRPCPPCHLLHTNETQHRVSVGTWLSAPSCGVACLSARGPLVCREPCLCFDNWSVASVWDVTMWTRVDSSNNTPLRWWQICLVVERLSLGRNKLQSRWRLTIWNAVGSSWAERRKAAQFDWLKLIVGHHLPYFWQRPQELAETFHFPHWQRFSLR
jgi:hypothetical protein